MGRSTKGGANYVVRQFDYEKTEMMFLSHLEHN